MIKLNYIVTELNPMQYKDPSFVCFPRGTAVKGGIFIFPKIQYVNPLLNSIKITYLNHIKHNFGV